MLITYLRTVIVNKENYYQQYKGHTKWLSLISSYFAKNIFWHDTSSCTSCSLYLYCICKVSESFSKSSKHKHNPYLVGNSKKWLTKLSFCQKLIF